jgi:hypothetical protein
LQKAKEFAPTERQGAVLEAVSLGQKHQDQEDIAIGGGWQTEEIAAGDDQFPIDRPSGPFVVDSISKEDRVATSIDPVLAQKACRKLAHIQKIWTYHRLLRR